MINLIENKEATNYGYVTHPQPNLALLHFEGTHDDPQPDEIPFAEINDTIFRVLSDLHSGQDTSSELLRTSSSKILLQAKH